MTPTNTRQDLWHSLMKINCKQSKFSRLWVNSCVDADNDLCLALEDYENYVSVYLSLEEISILQKHLAEVLKKHARDSVS